VSTAQPPNACRHCNSFLTPIPCSESNTRITSATRGIRDGLASLALHGVMRSATTIWVVFAGIGAVVSLITDN
jgi:hypothetical protein